jgi:hypothetical protein
MIPTIGEALPHIRYLQRDLSMALKLGLRRWESACPLSEKAQQELLWWERWVTTKNGLPIQVLPINLQNIDLTIHVDASQTGWDVQSELITISGFWTKEEQELSINVRELKTILFAFQLHTPSAANSIINLYTDNVTALKYVRKFGGTSSIYLDLFADRTTFLLPKYVS